VADGSEQHPRDPDIGAIAGGAVDLGRNVDPRQRFSVEPPGGERPEGHFGRDIVGGCQPRRFGKGHLPRLVKDRAIGGVERRLIDLPLPRRRADECDARRRRRFAERPLITADRGAAAGELQVEPFDDAGAGKGGDVAEDRRQALRSLRRQPGEGIGRMERRGFDRHQLPAGAELVGDDLGKARHHPLAHFGLRHRHRHPPVGPDPEPGVHRHFVGRGGHGVRPLPRPQHEADGDAEHGAGADEESAARRQKAPPAAIGARGRPGTAVRGHAGAPDAATIWTFLLARCMPLSDAGGA
jgi:hypothetical protein